jgi:hypothetical protein
LVAIGLTLALRAFDGCVRMWQMLLLHDSPTSPDGSLKGIGLTETLLQFPARVAGMVWVVAVLLFLWWIRRTAALTRSLGNPDLTWTPGSATAAFFLPFVNLYAPYVLLRDVHRALVPDALPEPEVRVRADDHTNYRQLRAIVPPPRLPVPRASIAGWWATYWLGAIVTMGARIFGQPGIVSRDERAILGDLLFITSGLLLIFVIRAVTARLRERYRRVRHNPIEVLQAAEIVIG